MLKNIRKSLLKSVASIITTVAMVGVSVNSMIFIYEPDIPECLKNDKKVN